MAGRTSWRAGGLDKLGRAPPDQGQTRPVKEDGRAAVELERIGAVFERHGASVQVSADRFAGGAGRHQELAQPAGQGADATVG